MSKAKKSDAVIKKKKPIEKKSDRLNELIENNKEVFDFIKTDIIMDEYIRVSREILDGKDVSTNIAIRNYIRYLCSKIKVIMDYDPIKERVENDVVNKLKF